MTEPEQAAASAPFPETKALDLAFDPARGWLTVWFNEPAARNALTAERASDIVALCAHLQPRRDVRGVVFRGRGGVFCAGGDLKAFGRIFGGAGPAGQRDEVVALSASGAALFDAVDSLPQLTVMAVEGAAMAGGLGLACVGDVVIAEEGAKFALTEVRLGLTPAQIAPFVLRRVGAARGRRLMLLAESLTGAEALSAGFVDELAAGESGVDQAVAGVQDQLRACAPGAVAGIKALIRSAPELERAAQIDAAAACFADALLSAEGREGVGSFLERRKPAWARAAED